MRYVLLGGIAVLAVGVSFSIFGIPTIIAEAVLTRDEINACATMIAIDDYMKGYPDFKPTRQQAIESLVLDDGTRPDYIAKSDGYHASIGLDTAYTVYVDKGKSLCLRLKAEGKKIEWPELKIGADCHISGGTASRALVCGNDPEPIFGCSDGYHSVTGRPGDDCVKN